MIKSSNWIKYVASEKVNCPEYKRIFTVKDDVEKATLYITARGVYEAKINGKRISKYVLAPGWTVYEKRHQYQEYDLTNFLKEENELTVTVADGWFQIDDAKHLNPSLATRDAGAIIAALYMVYKDGNEEVIYTDDAWLVGESKLLYSDIYNGEIYDANRTIEYKKVTIVDYPKDTLIPQEGEIICEHERLKPLAYLVTPKGEKVIDFGQNMTGYVEFTVNGKKGDIVKISHAEILDKDGNFYTENYRSAKASIEYICTDGVQTYKPTHNFYGFRYIRLDEFPEDVNVDDFTAIVVHSDIKQIGFLDSGSKLLNKFFSNVIWGQKSNFLDIPTDCPQRDERLGWTADAHIFIKAASYNYKVNRFFKKWLKDLVAEQLENGFVPNVIPNTLVRSTDGAAWGDAATICPWQLYLSFGDKEMLKEQYPSMKKWISYIQEKSLDEYLWTGGHHHGDWLGLDAPSGSYRGSSDTELISSAFYAYSTSLVIKAGKVLGEDVSYYEKLYENIIKAFRERFTEYKTQTEHVLAIAFDLAEEIQKTADSLARLIHENGDSLTTGFVGTPYLLHALTKGGYSDLAYTLLLREEYPSWLFSVRMGATTVWEHWDGLREDGSLWSSNMNSYNHYAYGAVLDWVYEIAAGIKIMSDYPAFKKVQIAPHPDKRLGHLEARVETDYGLLRSYWIYQQDDSVRYEITTPTDAKITIGDKTVFCPKGEYIFYSEN